MRNVRSILGVATLLTAAAPLSAQLPTGAKAIGMGGAFVATARGHESLFLNPANLGLPGTPYWSIAFPQLGFGSTLLGMRFEDMPDVINYDDIDQTRKDEILSSIPESGTEIRFDAKLPLFSMSNRRFALGVAYGMTGEHSLGKDLAELVMNGYQEGRTDYSVGRTEGSRATYLDVAAGFGRKLGPVSVGVTGHYYRGLTLMRSKLFEPRFDLAAQDFQMDYVGVHSRGGQGHGVDVGMALEPVKSLTVSAAVSNVYSKMTWNESLRSRTATLTKSDLVGDPDALITFKGRYERSEDDLDPSAASLEVIATAQELYRDAYFPAVLRAGAAWRPSEATDLGIAYETKLSEGRLGDRWDRTVSVGLQQKLQLGVAKITDGTLEGGERRGYVATFGLSMSSNVIGEMPRR